MAISSEPEAIISRLESSDPSQVLEAVQGIGPGDASEALEERLLTLLQETTDAKLRNAAAIALADTWSKHAPAVIERLVLDPSTKLSRATLLYALRETRAPVSLRFIVDVLLDNISDGLHACEECFGILERSPVVASAHEKNEQLQRLRSYTDGVNDGERRELLEDAYETTQLLPKTYEEVTVVRD